MKTTASVHKKQRHTAQRIFERLRDEEGFSGGYTIVREYVAQAMLRSREMFVPLSHRPGHAQADFGQADGYIAGKKVRFHYFCMDLPHSDGCFVKAYPAETAEAFCDGHVAAFDFFGGVPQSILYDNTRLAVAKIVKGGKRLRSQMFAELQSHYLFEDRFGRPGKGNDKGKVEGLVGYVRRNFMTPLPVADSFDALNARFLDACIKRRQAILRGQTTTIGERMQADISAFMPLPPAPYDACHKVATRVSSLSLVRYRNNDYSVPTRYGHQEVLAKGYVDRVEIVCRGETIATHIRSYDTAEFIYNPLHYLALLEQKSKALDQAAPLDDWRPRRMHPSSAAADGSADGQPRPARVHSGAAIDGGLSPTSGRTGCRRRAAAGRHQLRRGEDAAARQIGEPAGPARSDVLPLPAGRDGRRNGSTRLSRAHRQRGLHACGCGRFGMTTLYEPGSQTIVAPQVLLGNHLKALKLPTFAREYEKVAMESAQDRADYPRFLLRLCELERIDRERRNVERRIRLARFSQIKSLDTFDFAAQPSLNKSLVLELARCEWIEKRQNCIALGPSGTGKTPRCPLTRARCLSERLQRRLHVCRRSRARTHGSA